MILRILQIVLWSTIAAAVATAAGPATLLSSQLVARVVSQNAMQVSPSQVRFLSAVTSRHENPDLDLVSIGPWGQHTMKARLVCHDRSECLPFYVAVQVDGSVFREEWAKTVPLEPPAKREPPIIRAGAEATLVLRGEGLQITIPVICLENGEIGRSIRVTTRDRKQIYKAEIVSAILLRGRI